MRILFLNHFPLHSPSGRWVEHCRRALAEAGHETRAVIVSRPVTATISDSPSTVRAITCSATDPTANLRFDVPCFRGQPVDGSQQTFDTLSDEQMHEYRDQLRRAMDMEIDRFDPQAIHAQHIWIQAQLALETGVPYLVSAWGEELDDYRLDAGLQAFADQAAENAGRILAGSTELSQRIDNQFEGVTERIVPFDPTAASAQSPQQLATTLVALYQAIFQDRFGRPL